MSSKETSQQRSEAELKKQRLAEALRENLKRRKSQKRGRSAVQSASADIQSNDHQPNDHQPNDQITKETK